MFLKRDQRSKALHRTSFKDLQRAINGCITIDNGRHQSTTLLPGWYYISSPPSRIQTELLVRRIGGRCGGGASVIGNCITTPHLVHCRTTTTNELVQYPCDLSCPVTPHPVLYTPVLYHPVPSPRTVRSVHCRTTTNNELVRPGMTVLPLL